MDLKHILLKINIPILFGSLCLFYNSEKSHIKAEQSSATLHKCVVDSGAHAIAFTNSL